MIFAIALTVKAIILGDAITPLLQLPAPAAVIGLLCAAICFVRRGSPDPAMAWMFDAMLPHAPILFVPARAPAAPSLSPASLEDR